MVREMKESNNSSDSIKFLCSYGGKILPRRSDYKLRYVGGYTRVLSVDRSVSYAELMVKLVEFCGVSVTLNCQLPNGDLDTMISVKSDEELASVMEEYDRVARSNPCSSIQKIRAVLAPPKNLKKVSPPLSSSSSVVDFSGYRPPVSDDRLRRQVTEKLSSLQNSTWAIGYPVSLHGAPAKSRCTSPSCYYDHRAPRGLCRAPCCNYLASDETSDALKNTSSTVVYTHTRTRR